MPRHTIRLRLTILYGGLFLACGACLLTITYILVARQYSGNFFVFSTDAGGPSGSFGVSGVGDPVIPDVVAPQEVMTPDQIQTQAHNQTSAALHQLLIQSGIALAIMAVISICVGWLIAGRALRPLRTITRAAREISASSLHRRLVLDGPDDELKQLGDTFNDLIERLEASFDAQRRFVANASHELRTPLTLERTLVEVALANPNATADTLRETCRRVLAAGAQQERLIEALLTLSRGQRGLDRHEPFDLAAVAREVLGTRHSEAQRHGLRIDTALTPAPTSGDPRLGERLVANLIDNAIRHNIRGGVVEVVTATSAGRAVVSVANTGPIVPPDEIGRLLQPFQRLTANRNGNDDNLGLGLGLSIVHAIAGAHGGTLDVETQPGGGLVVKVSFPKATAPAASTRVPGLRQPSPL
jgi:signal transduction histidine kinase